MSEVVSFHALDEHVHTQHVTDVHEQFTKWCKEKGEQQFDPIAYQLFCYETKLHMCMQCPESLVRQSTLSFGGADGGGGILITGVQQEHMDRAFEASKCSTVVAPLTHMGYELTLDSHVEEHIPRGAPYRRERDDRGYVYLVQSELQHSLREIVESRPHMRSNVRGIMRLSKAQIAEALAFIRSQAEERAKALERTQKTACRPAPCRVKSHHIIALS